MNKKTHFLKKIFSYIFKAIIAVLMGVGISMGKNIALTEKKNNKTIEAKK